MCQNCIDKQESCKDESHSLLLEPYFAVEINLVTPDEEIRRFVDFGLEYTGKSPQGDPDERCARRPTAARLARKCRRDLVLKSWISSAVVSQAKGNFLFAKLYMDCLEQQHTVKQVKEILQNPFVLENHYEPTMVRINSQPKEDSALAKKAISWIVSSRRPLKVEELQQAMAIVPGTEEINPETSCEIPHLLSVTAGFMTVDSKHTVRLAHQTAQTYLGLQAKKWFPSVEVDIALAIVSYLGIKAISKPCLGSRDGQEFKARRKTHPFLLYAAVYWSNHVRDVIHDPIVQATVLRFVRDPSNLASCFQAASWAVATGGPNEWHPWGSPNILHECAKSGLTPIIPELLADGYGIDSQDSTYGLTALSYACRAGYGETVKLLLDLGASVNIRGLNGTTALFEAIWGGHTDLVELLLTKAELNINTVYASHTQRTVLMIAAQDGAEEVVRCLLQRVDLDINKSDISRSTALILAAANGHTSVVSLLLNHEGIKIDRRDLVGRSALIAAADNGFSEIVGRLLAKGADLHSSRTVIQRAVQLGYFFVVETMAAHGVDIRALNGLGRSLLHDAALRGSDDIVRLLILKGLDLNAQCHQGCTPLHYASRFNMFSVTKVLLELGADPSFKDSYGRTPVVVVWQEGHMRVARILEGQDSTAGMEEEIPTAIAKTLPIWSVAKLGRVDLLASILSNGTNLGEKDPYTNNSAIHLAVSWNHYDILQMLLDADLSPDCINDEHETPLHFAARIANIEAVELLLQHRADIGSVDLFGDTPLQIALEEDHLSVAIQLIHGSLNTTKDIQIEIPKEYVQPLFFSAAKAGNAKVLECLIDKRAHIMAKDQDGHTALQLAETAGFGDITETLETRLDIFKYKKRVTLLKNIEE